MVKLIQVRKIHFLQNGDFEIRSPAGVLGNFSTKIQMSNDNVFYFKTPKITQEELDNMSSADYTFFKNNRQVGVQKEFFKFISVYQYLDDYYLFPLDEAWVTLNLVADTFGFSEMGYNNPPNNLQKQIIYNQL